MHALKKISWLASPFYPVLCHLYYIGCLPLLYTNTPATTLSSRNAIFVALPATRIYLSGPADCYSLGACLSPASPSEVALLSLVQSSQYLADSTKETRSALCIFPCAMLCVPRGRKRWWRRSIRKEKFRLGLTMKTKAKQRKEDLSNKIDQKWKLLNDANWAMGIQHVVQWRNKMARSEWKNSAS